MAYAVECTFLNPLIAAGQDPSVVYHEGYYYLVQSTASGLTITKSDTITGLGSELSVQVYAPPPNQPYSYDLWAPELLYIRGNWYIYVAATDSPGNNPSHRMYVLQADTADPLGTWTMKGKIYDPAADRWAIDGTVFEYNETLYMVWSGWETEQGDFPQNLYIAEMSDPLTLAGPRHLLSEPDQPWEQTVAALQEGPQTFIHNNRLSIVYSADASWTPAYKLGILTLTGDDPLDRNSWTKSGPVFEQVPDADTPVYGPGHNSNPVLSPNGEEYWFFYHAKRLSTPGWDDRGIRTQKFTWSSDDIPVFGEPIPASVAQPIPAGEACGLVTEFGEIQFDDTGFMDTGKSWLRTRRSFSVAAEVQLTKTEGPYAFVSQEGGISSNFVLGYQDGKFVFTMYDSFGRGAVSAESLEEPQLNTWYQLVGVYDTSGQQLALYVNGELQNTATFDRPWEAPGSTIIGAARHQTKRADIFNGDMRNVKLIQGALSSAEVEELD